MCFFLYQSSTAPETSRVIGKAWKRCHFWCCRVSVATMFSDSFKHLAVARPGLPCSHAGPPFVTQYLSSESHLSTSFFIVSRDRRYPAAPELNTSASFFMACPSYMSSLASRCSKYLHRCSGITNFVQGDKHEVSTRRKSKGKIATPRTYCMVIHKECEVWVNLLIDSPDDIVQTRQPIIERYGRRNQ